MPKRKPNTQKDLLVSLLDSQRKKLVSTEDEEIPDETEPIPEALLSKVKSNRKRRR